MLVINSARDRRSERESGAGRFSGMIMEEAHPIRGFWLNPFARERIEHELYFEGHNDDLTCIEPAPKAQTKRILDFKRTDRN